MSAIKGSYYPPEIIDTDGNIENEGVYGKNTPFVSDDHMGIINLQGANIDYLKTAVDNLGSNTTAAQNQLQTNIDTNNTNQTNALNTVKTDLTNLINSNKSTQDAKNTAYDSHLSTLDSKTDTNASNITALQTSDNDKFKTATVNNATITLTKGTGATTSLTVNNVANATNATNASYTTTQAATDNSTKIASTEFVRTAVANLVSSAPATLDTLNELATALGNDPNFATTVSKNIGAIDAKANTNASNITALQASDNAKFKAVSVSNDTLTFTKGDNTTTAVAVNNVANATNATNATYASIMRWYLGSFEGKTIADLRTALMSAYKTIGNVNTAYVYFAANIIDVVSGWGTTTTTLTPGGYCTVRISNNAISGNGYFHGTLYAYDVPEYTFSVINGVWSALNRNLVQSDYDTLNSAITTTNTNLSSLSSTVTSNKSAQDTKNSSYESRLTAVESKATTNATNISTLTTNDNAKFKSVSVSNATLTFTNGGGTTTSVTVNNVANATNATNASYTTTQAATDNSTKIASTAFVKTAVANLVSSAPSTLDTLNELANALGNDPNFATTVSTQIGNKADRTELNNSLALHDASDTAHETRFKLFEKIADFGNDIIKKLALTTAITAITALETNSWFGQLLKMVLTASGVKYNIAQNGYVCLGSFFGGLIIQWGKSTSPITFPIAFNVLYAYEMLHNSSLSHKTIPLPGASDGARLFFDLWNMQANDYDAAGEAIYIAVGK